MNHTRLKLWRIGGIKLAILLLIFVSGATAYATLGDGKAKKGMPGSSLLSNKNPITPGSFSLKSGFNYRGSQVILLNSERRSVRLNTVVTLQKGTTTYIVPLKKKVILDKVKISIGNRQFRKN